MTECISCGNPHVENFDTGLCASCGAKERKSGRLKIPDDPKSINKVSDNQAKLNAIYLKEVKKWVNGKMCAVFPRQKATQCHHMQGRVGYADEWARENEVPLLLDKRFWLPTSDEGHRKITENPLWAWENQFSFKRVGDKIFHKVTQ